MGWSSGTDVAIPIIESVKNNVDDEKARKRIYKAIIKALQGADWDCQDEARGIDPIFDELLENS